MSRSPHWQEDLSQGDQGETRQSTGQSTLQHGDDDEEEVDGDAAADDDDHARGG